MRGPALRVATAVGYSSVLMVAVVVEPALGVLACAVAGVCLWFALEARDDQGKALDLVRAALDGWAQAESRANPHTTFYVPVLRPEERQN